MHAIAIHGGAGTLPRAEMKPDQEAAYRAGLATALDAGYAVLEGGGTSLDAVTAAVRILEDDPLFNAGRGAVLTHEGTVELDASIMDGRTLAAGAIAGVAHIRNPIELARAVMEHSPHVMLIGAGAEEFAHTRNIAFVANDYFKTGTRKAQLRRVLVGDTRPANELSALGTVGAVARDQAGNLAAATSTGGMTGKRYGRVGDSPIIGAGTYADNGSCAVSSTGHGEYFIRTVVAHDICARVAYGGATLQEAADAVVMQRLATMGGEGGIIAVDANGQIVMSFNSEGMFRGARASDGKREVSIYRDR
ncbi:MAG TPA: isoaspartyl peptidase/L-asparaginase [Steroidobacteraceae bacterium]|nr:isoaspartyl peptidase/L-asparaginase [Steroidobacteraceae bacterium]HQW08048.1 isoaspartyl peptidase/L-asparaginase [Steroidobacteraceae bacterium]HQX46644.1 isoaspartyl peptidase/L-asparaginase [Steroidobacteraceae bacterium]HQX78677.1 isoaspartyl peptidase/L-asparaginase [Steroidobacteraceae bacterium]HQZ80545.1 isoaspartyl peptidase/L-asparaginase [Steroidobacteraceae bacterium]